jgi:hypothetical protein
VPSEVLSNSKRTFGKRKLWGNCETPYKYLNGGLKAVQLFFKELYQDLKIVENIGSKQRLQIFLIKMNCGHLKGNFDISHKQSGFTVLKLLKLLKEHAVETLKLQIEC